MPDKLLDIDAAVPEGPAFFVRLGDLGLERDDPFKARREVGHLALLFCRPAVPSPGRQPGQTPLSLRPFALTSHTAGRPSRPSMRCPRHGQDCVKICTHERGDKRGGLADPRPG